MSVYSAILYIIIYGTGLTLNLALYVSKVILTLASLVFQLHRVSVPEDKEACKKTRRSVKFFAIPSEDAEICCLDGSKKYQPMNMANFMEMKTRLFLSQ